MQLRTVLLSTSVLVAVLGACGDDDTDPSVSGASDTSTETDATSSGGDDAAAGTTLTIAGFAFTAVPDAVAGEPITVVNEDGAPHTVSAADGTFDTGTIAAGESVQLVIDAAGTYEFRCLIHSTMTGEITVS